MIFATTRRLCLRSYEERDIPQLTRLLNNWNVTKWIGMIPMPYTRRDAEEWLQKMAAIEESGKPEYLLITNLRNDEPIGSIGFHPLHNVLGKPGDYEMGYWLAQRHWGRGFMSEAGHAALRWAMLQPWIKNLFLTTDIENKASRNVAEKLGFVFQENRPRSEGRGNDEITLWTYPKDEPQ